MKKRTKRILMVVCSVIAILSSVLYMNVFATDDADTDAATPEVIATQDEATEMDYEEAQEFIDSYPYSPHLLRLLEEQVLMATSAQDKRDLIRILAALYKSRGHLVPLLTAADFRLQIVVQLSRFGCAA